MNIKDAITLLALAMIAACGQVPDAPQAFQCRTSCKEVPKAPAAFNVARTIILAAENHDQCDDADVLTRSYEELDILRFDATGSMTAVFELKSCLDELDR